MLGPGAQQSERGERERGLEPTLRDSRDIELSQGCENVASGQQIFCKGSSQQKFTETETRAHQK